MVKPILSRRGLFGAGLAGAVALSGAGAREAEAAEDAPGTGPLKQGERPNVLVVVLSGMRRDSVSKYGDGGHTPNLDRLADHGMRFRRAIPEALPAVPVRRAVLTGMRSYPFRDWRKVEGIPAIPGWNPIWSWQPLLPERLAAADVKTVLISDDPLLGGERFAPFLQRTTSVPSLQNCDPDDDPCGACLSCLAADPNKVPGYLVPLKAGLTAAEDPTKRVMSKAISTLDGLRDQQPFALMVDVFDPAAIAAPPVAFAEGDDVLARDIFTPGDLDLQRRIELDSVSADTAREVRRRYRDQQTANDAQLGRLLDKLDALDLTQRTFVVVVSDGGVALGEHGVWGYPEGVGMVDPYEVPFIIRDPHGRRSGDESHYLATTHDIAPTVLSVLGVGRPGRMEGEDLTGLLDDELMPSRSVNATLAGTTVIAIDHDDYTLVADIGEQTRQIYDDDGDNSTSGEAARLDGLWSTAIAQAGGTFPEFGDAAAIRPRYTADDQKVLRDLGHDKADTDD